MSLHNLSPYWYFLEKYPLKKNESTRLQDDELGAIPQNYEQKVDCGVFWKKLDFLDKKLVILRLGGFKFNEIAKKLFLKNSLVYKRFQRMREKL